MMNSSLGVISVETSDAIIIDNYNWYSINKALVDNLVQTGKTAFFLELPEGKYIIVGSEVSLRNTIIGNYYFVSKYRARTCKVVRLLDFRFWYNEKQKLVTPLIATVLKANDWKPVFATGLTSWDSRDEGTYLAVAEKRLGKGEYVICRQRLNNRININTTAKEVCLYII